MRHYTACFAEDVSELIALEDVLLGSCKICVLRSGPRPEDATALSPSTVTPGILIDRQISCLILESNIKGKILVTVHQITDPREVVFLGHY